MESVSGGGSTLDHTRELRQTLPGLLSELNVRSLLDAPCGDFNWMRKTDLGVDQYIGADIVAPMIEKLQRRYGQARRRFMVLNIIADPLPEAEAMLCRDCLIHFSNPDVLRFLRHFSESSCKFLLTTTYPKIAENRVIDTGRFRPINLEGPPFNLPRPLRWIDDSHANDEPHCLAVWEREKLAEHFSR